jgi:hypothetical protein
MERVGRHIRETLLPQLRQVPGFASFYLIDAGDGLLASVAMFDTSDGARAGDGLLDQWFRVDWPAFRAVSPAVTGGTVLLADEPRRAATQRPSSSVMPRLERRVGGDRRTSERRRGVDRRVLEQQHALAISHAQ